MQPEYYQGHCEREILNTQMDAIAEYIPDDTAIMKLGCGAMTKTMVILDYLRRDEALEKLKQDEDRRDVLPEHAVTYAGIHGSYKQGIAFLQEIPGPRVMLWLGSSLVTMALEQQADLFGQYSRAMSVGDKIIIGVDKRKDPKIVVKAHNDVKGVGYEIGMNSLTHLNAIIGTEVFDTDHFARWAAYNDELGRMELYVKSTKDQTVTIPSPFSGSTVENVDVDLKKDEYIRYSISTKYSMEDLENLGKTSNLTLEKIFTDKRELFYLSLLQRL